MLVRQTQQFMATIHFCRAGISAPQMHHSLDGTQCSSPSAQNTTLALFTAATTAPFVGLLCQLALSVCVCVCVLVVCWPLAVPVVRAGSPSKVLHTIESLGASASMHALQLEVLLCVLKLGGVVQNVIH